MSPYSSTNKRYFIGLTVLVLSTIDEAFKYVCVHSSVATIGLVVPRRLFYFFFCLTWFCRTAVPCVLAFALIIIFCAYCRVVADLLYILRRSTPAFRLKQVSFIFVSILSGNSIIIHEMNMFTDKSKYYQRNTIRIYLPTHQIYIPVYMI